MKIIIEPLKKFVRNSEYSKSDTLKKLSTVTEILSLFNRIREVFADINANQNNPTWRATSP